MCLTIDILAIIYFDMQFDKATDFILKKLDRELPKHLYYHCIAHTEDVYASAKMLAKMEQVNAYQTELVLTAACYHDSGFLNSIIGHEEVSCIIASQNLRLFKYTKAEIELICGMIRATRIPQNPKNHLEQILADADLDYLGRNDFFTISHKLFRELIHTGIINDDAEWNEVQLNFIESHQYFTKSASILREDKKQSNLEKVKALLH